MRLFWQLAKRAYQRQLAYRAATVAGLATNFFFGLLRASVLIALYGGQTQVEGITLQGAATYTSLTQGIIIGAAITFWTIESIEVINIFTYGGTEMMAYPMHIYQDWMWSPKSASASLFAISTASAARRSC